MKDSGYFGTKAAAKPLLHTWSLAVEEQFYFILPFYMLLVRRWSATVAKRVTGAVCLVSLLLSSGITPYELTASFFMLPTRAWELLVGVLLAQGVVPGPLKLADELARAAIGLGLIAFAVVFYSEETSFPGIAAVPPTLGAALIISAGMGHSRRANAWLARRPMIFIGKISYPLYLWHFPVLGFASYLSLSGLGVAKVAAAILIMVACSVFSWRFVERPIRERRALRGQRSLFVSCSVCAAATLFLGLAIHFERGIEGRFGGDQLAIVQGMTDRMAGRDRCMNLSPEDIAKGDFCRLGLSDLAMPANTVVWGDSHGEALAPGIADAAARVGKSALFAGKHGCEIGKHFQDAGWEARACSAFSKAMLDYLITAPSIRQVVLVSRWLPLREDKSSADRDHPGIAAAERLAKVVAQLTDAGKHVWLVGPVPDVKTFVPRGLYLKSLGLEQDFEIRPSALEFDAAQQVTLSVLRDLASHPGVSIVYPHEVLCSSGWCEVARDGRPLYFDDNHLTTYGAKLVAPVLDRVFG